MITKKLTQALSAARRVTPRRGAAVLAGAAIAAGLTGLAAGTAQAAPIDDSIGLPPELVKTLEELPTNGSADLDALLKLIPGLEGQNVLPASGKTKCDVVVHLGDGSSVGADNGARLAKSEDRLSAQYKRGGADTVILDVDDGATLNTIAASAKAEKAKRTGKDACFVVAAGTDDAQAGEDAVAKRIDAVMKSVNGSPVLWPTVAVSDKSTAAGYSEKDMWTFNDALNEAARKYSNLRVYDFAADVDDSWFAADGVNFNEKGMTERNKRLADALAGAYPAGVSLPGLDGVTGDQNKPDEKTEEKDEESTTTTPPSTTSPAPSSPAPSTPGEDDQAQNTAPATTTTPAPGANPLPADAVNALDGLLGQ